MLLCKDLQIKILSFGLHIFATMLQNSYQDNWNKTPKLLGQILKLPVVKQLKYALVFAGVIHT